MVMAEETVDIPVSVETVDIQVPVTVETVDIPSLKKIGLEGGHVRRNLIGNLGTMYTGTKVLSRYLKTSIGSCHDSCKYGIKHLCETKSTSPKPKRIITRAGEGECLAKTVNSLQRKKKSVISHKPSPDSNSQTPDKNQVTKKEVSASAKKAAASPKHVSSPRDGLDVSRKVASDVKLKPLPDSNSQTPDKNQDTKKEVSASAKKAAASPKHVSSPREGLGVSRKVASDVKPKRLLTKSSSLPIPIHLSSRGYSEIIIPKRTEARKMSPLGGSSNTRKSDICKNNEVETPKTRKKNNLMQPTVPLSPKSTVKRFFSQKSDNYRNLRKVSLLKNQQNERKAEPEQQNNGTVPEKTLYVIETKPTGLTVELAQSDSPFAHSSPSLSPSSEDESLGFDQKGTHTSLSPTSSEDKISEQIQTDIYTCQSSSSSPPSSENRSLRRTRNENHNTRLSSLSLLSSSSPALDSSKTDEGGLISEHNGTENQKVERKGRPRRVGRVSSEDRDRSPRKVNFRRRKLVDVHYEKNDPRRLRFRQGKVPGENQNGKADTKRRSLRREISDCKSNATNAETVEVVLRHQDVEGKKDVQNLFNEVIEETASKLVLDRKSKVKALVGAFETVISLQDTNSLATTKTN